MYERSIVDREMEIQRAKSRTNYIYKREKIESVEKEDCTGSFVTSLGKNLVDSGEKQGAM